MRKILNELYMLLALMILLKRIKDWPSIYASNIIRLE